MLFNSFEFFVFLPIVFVLYWFVFNKLLFLQNVFLLVTSYFFYGYWSWKFLFLLISCTLLDYLYGIAVANFNGLYKRFFLWLSIINNLGILCVFKYYDFFVSQIQIGLERFGFNSSPLLLNFALPIGISFYTFHGMSYVFDIYRGVQRPIINLVDYAVFVSFFPLLVAGPIERANHLLPQIQSRRNFNYVQAIYGCRQILWGLFKKVVIADSLSLTVDSIFYNYSQHNSFTLILGTIGFSFQIYCDFSGYSDMAMGIARLFGFELLSNFKFPYFSRDIAEFWRRWHISLSSWFKDYVYIPLGGSKAGKYISIRNTFIIFLISGFWHGASWNYLAWGGIHACLFLPLLLSNKNRKYTGDVVAENNRFPTIKELFQMCGTFILVAFAWIFFRASTINEAFSFLNQLFRNLFKFDDDAYFSLPSGIGISSFIFIPILLIIDWNLRFDDRKIDFPKYIKPFRIVIYILVIIYCLKYLVLNQNQSFIYFQF